MPADPVNVRGHRTRSGKIVTNLAASISLVATMLPIPHQSAAIQEATGCFLQFLRVLSKTWIWASSL